MLQLLELYDLSEMARTRGDATWAMLDWCAKQPDDFTIDDAYRVYVRAGGQSNATAFASIFNRFVAKYDPNSPKDRYRSEAEYGLSQERPIAIVRQGRRGKGGAALYRWGLDGPLREPPAATEPSSDDGGEGEEDHIGDALDALEKSMGRPALKAALERWRGMKGDHRRISQDIRLTVRPRDQMNALMVATQGSAPAGGSSTAELGPEPPAATPFTPGNPRRDLPPPQPPGRRRPEVEPEEEPTEPDARGSNGDFEDEEPTNPDMAPPDFGGGGGDAGGDSEDGSKEGEGEGTDEFDTSDYPDWLPAARRKGSPAERAMFRLLSPKDEGGAGISPTSRLWRAIEDAEDGGAAREALANLFARSKVDPKFLPDAQAVAADVFDDSDEGDEEEGGGEEGEDEAEGEGHGETEGEGENDDRGEDDGEGGEDDGNGDETPWLPRSDEDGSRAESAMARLTDEFGVRRDDPIFSELRGAKDSVDAHRLIKASELPANAGRYALVVAKEIFARDGRDWDTGKRLPGGPRRESLSRLRRIFREETEDDVVPDPSRRGRVGVFRVMPDFGMDEAQLDQVDFAVRTGLGRIMRDRRS